MLEWDELRFFLAVSRAGTLSAAARALGVDQTTVGRRLSALEEVLGAKLFERARSGLSLTSLGRELLPALEAMEEAALSVERRASGEDAKLSGRVRIATTEAFATRFLVQSLPAFQERYPGIELELLTGNEVLDLSRREADVSIRAVKPTQPSLVGRRVAELAIAVYASERYLARFGAPDPSNGLRGHQVLGYGASGRGWPEARWLAAHATQARVVLRQSSVLGVLAGAVAGLGLGVLPCFLGDAEPTLRRALPPDPRLKREIWVAMHRDLQRNAKVRAVVGFLTDLLEREAPLFRGEAASPRRAATR